MSEVNTAIALHLAQGDISSSIYSSTTLWFSIAILFVIFFICSIQKIGELVLTLIYNLYLKLTKKNN